MGSKSKKRRIEARAQAKVNQGQQQQNGAHQPAPQQPQPQQQQPQQHQQQPQPATPASSSSLSSSDTDTDDEPMQQQQQQQTPSTSKKRQRSQSPAGAAPAVAQQPPLRATARSPSAQPASTPLSARHRRSTSLSIAVPGSILDSVPSHEAAAAVAGQLARAASIFGAEEVVVYDDTPSTSSHWDGTISAGTAALARLLQYLETPPYLRSSLCPQTGASPELRAVDAICPALHALHHLRGQEWRPYREGMVMKSEPGMGSFIDIGYERNAHVSLNLPEGARVTLAVGNAPTPCFVPAFSETMLEARVVPPSEPRAQLGIYWGFRVRVARGINRVLKECPFKAGYDLTVGISEEGVQREGTAELVLPRFKHALVVFGGAKGLEEIADADFSVAQSGKAAADLFSLYLNCCPESMGVKDVRREDEVLVSLGYLYPALAKYGSA